MKLVFVRLGFVSCLLLSGMMDGLAAPGESGMRPNIILCMTDDQGWGDVGFNGLKKIATPNLDAMAAAGLRFERFYAQPSCSPTRAGIMTGRHSNRMGVFYPGMPIRTQERTIAQILQKAGYRTGHFGKWHLNGVSGPGKVIKADDPCSPLRLGFDESFSVSNYFETDWTFSMSQRPRPFGSWQFGGNASKINSNSGPAAWIDNRYKLVKPKPGQWELYDLTNDRAESHDLAAREPEVLERMKAELETWQQSVIRSFQGEDYP